MIEPHMTLAILSLQKTCQRPAGPKDEDAFYQQYREPFYRRLYQGWVRFSAQFQGHRQPREDVPTVNHPVVVFESCR